MALFFGFRAKLHDTLKDRQFRGGRERVSPHEFGTHEVAHDSAAFIAGTSKR